VRLPLRPATPGRSNDGPLGLQRNQRIGRGARRVVILERCAERNSASHAATSFGWSLTRPARIGLAWSALRSESTARQDPSAGWVFRIRLQRAPHRFLRDRGSPFIKCARERAQHADRIRLIAQHGAQIGDRDFASCSKARYPPQNQRLVSRGFCQAPAQSVFSRFDLVALRKQCANRSRAMIPVEFNPSWSMTSR